MPSPPSPRASSGPSAKEVEALQNICTPDPLADLSSRAETLRLPTLQASLDAIQATQAECGAATQRLEQSVVEVLSMLKSQQEVTNKRQSDVASRAAARKTRATSRARETAIARKTASAVVPEVKDGACTAEAPKDPEKRGAIAMQRATEDGALLPTLNDKDKNTNLNPIVEEAEVSGIQGVAKVWEEFATPTMTLEEKPKNGILKRKHNLPDTCLTRMVMTPAFDLFFGLLICLSAVCTGVEVEAQVQHPGEESALFPVVRYGFCLIFLLELVMRMAAMRMQFFHSTAFKAWNYFDLSLVTASIAELGVDIYVQIHGAEAAGVDYILSMMRFLRLMRIVRVLRFCPPLRLMVFMICESARSLLWLLILLAIVIYAFAICFTDRALVFLQRADAQDSPAYEKMNHFFGNTSRSMYSLFAAMAGGISWMEQVDTLIDARNGVMVCIFLFYISFALFALTNIVTGVFVDGAIQKSQSDRDLVVEKAIAERKRCVAHLRAIFEEADADGSGFVTIEEFHNQMKLEHVQAYMSVLNIDTEDSQKLFDLIDRDESGTVELSEFTEVLLQLKGNVSNMDILIMIEENKRVLRKFYEQSELVEDILASKGANMESHWTTIDSKATRSGNDCTRATGPNGSIVSLPA